MEVVTGAMGSLIPKLGELLGEEYKLQKGVKKDIAFLQSEMRSMQAALIKIGGVPWDQLDQQVKIWPDEVRELSYDMEDVVDNFLVRVGDSDPAANSNKIKQLMEEMTKLFSKGKARHEIANAIKDIKDLTQEVAARRDRYKVNDAIANTSSVNNVDPRLFLAIQRPTTIHTATENLRSMIHTCGKFRHRLKKGCRQAGPKEPNPLLPCDASGKTIFTLLLPC
jgi:hypothetical protein